MSSGLAMGGIVNSLWDLRGRIEVKLYQVRLPLTLLLARGGVNLTPLRFFFK